MHTQIIGKWIGIIAGFSLAYFPMMSAKNKRDRDNTVALNV